MPSGGRAVSLRLGCLSLSLSFDGAAFCAAPAAAVSTSDAAAVQARRFLCVTIPCVHSTANEGSRDNERMIYAQLPLPAVDADVVVMPWFEDGTVSSLPGVDAATGGELKRALDTKELSGRQYELFITGISDAAWKTRR